MRSPEDRDAVQRSQHLAPPAQVVGVLRRRQRVGVELDDGVHARAVLVQSLDALDVEAGQLDRREQPAAHPVLELGDGRLVEPVEIVLIAVGACRDQDNRQGGADPHCPCHLCPPRGGWGSVHSAVRGRLSTGKKV